MTMGIRYAALRFLLTGIDRLAGQRSLKIRTSSRYLVGLIDQQRFSEVDALLAHAIRKLRRTGVDAARSERRPRRDTTVIDAATQRLDAAGSVVAKRCWIYPGTQASILVSVVIPCYNYGRFLPDAIASARAQTVTSREIIIVDDGSTEPDTIALVDELQKTPDLRVLRQANAGLPSARNAGIDIANGEFICCLDADDMLDATYLETAIAKLLTDRTAGFAFPYVRYFGDVEEIWETHEFDIDEALIANFTAVSAVFRRDDWAEAGGYAPEMRGGFEDWEFWIRLACLGRRGRVLRQPLFLHRRHGRTMTSEAKERSDELHARIRARNPTPFTNRAFRRRLKRLVPPDRGALARLSAAVSPGPLPGLLIVVAWARRGGAEVLLLSILRALSLRWRIVFVTTEADPHAMTDDFRSVTGEVFHLSGTIDPADRIAFLAHLCRTRGVTHGLSSASAWLLTALPNLKASFPNMRWVHITHAEVPDSVFRAAVAAGAAVDRHVAVSSLVSNSLGAAGIDATRIIQIDNGIDPAPFAEAASSRMSMRQHLGIAPEENVLVWIGRFAPEKRPGLFVEALSTLDDLSIRGLMVGEGPLEAAVDTVIRASPLGSRIRRLGHQTREQVAKLLGAADLLVVTSSHEGLPLVVLEALAAGCPVVAIDVGDINQVVRPGENGVLVDPTRPEHLEPAIREALHQLQGDEVRARIRNCFADGHHTVEMMSQNYAAVLEDLH